jgi:hypothetical protein
MTSDAGLANQDTDDAREIQAVLDELHQMQQAPRLVTSPEERTALERQIPHSTALCGGAPTLVVISLHLCSRIPILGHQLHRPSIQRMTHAQYSPPDPPKPDHHG